MSLSVALKIPVHDIMEWPNDIINSYRAYNLLFPFSHVADMHREGLVIELLRNQNVTKKHHYKSADDLIPYLKHELPKQFEHPDLLKANKLLSIAMNEETRKEIMGHIWETLSHAAQQPDKDEYLIRGLAKLYFGEQKENGE